MTSIRTRPGTATGDHRSQSRLWTIFVRNKFQNFRMNPVRCLKGSLVFLSIASFLASLTSLSPSYQHLLINYTSGFVQDETFHYLYQPDLYSKQLESSLRALPDLKTGSHNHNFWSGFCNQFMMFNGLIFLAVDGNFSQILIESVKWKDQFGTNDLIRYDHLFDVVHWNSYHPSLPRMVLHNEHLFPDIEVIPGRSRLVKNPKDTIKMSPRLQWKITGDPFVNATKPHPIGKKQTQAIHLFLEYTNKIHRLGNERRNEELAIMTGALKPHPIIKDMIRKFLYDFNSQSGSRKSTFGVLHARIEPDMQNHGACMDKKVTNFTEIINQIQTSLNPPTGLTTMVVILNRELLENEVSDGGIKNPLAVYNLDVLNELLMNGLWKGKVKVIEAGSKLAKDQHMYDIYSGYSTIVGGIINFFLSLDASVFIGTEVSSYSSMVITSRFFRNKYDNYFYSPKNLSLVTPHDAGGPPKFKC